MADEFKNKGWLLMASGERIRIQGEFTLEFLQKMVAGPGQSSTTPGGQRGPWSTIEMLMTKDGEQMIINEDGKMLELEGNYAATKLLRSEIPDTILGDVVVIDSGFEID